MVSFYLFVFIYWGIHTVLVKQFFFENTEFIKKSTISTAHVNSINMVTSLLVQWHGIEYIRNND